MDSDIQKGRAQSLIIVVGTATLVVRIGILVFG